MHRLTLALCVVLSCAVNVWGSEASQQRVRNAALWNPAQVDTHQWAYVVQLDDTGIADLRHLNFRNPPLIGTPMPGKTYVLLFQNLTADREFTVTFETNGLTPPVETKEGFSISCAEGGGACTATGRVPRGGIAFIDTSVLKPDKTTAFRVRFYSELETPTNTRGYLAVYKPSKLDPQLLQPTGGVAAAIEPALPIVENPDLTKQSVISEANPLTGNSRHVFRGAARLDNIVYAENWGSAEATLALEDGELGRDNTLTVSASRYRINLLAKNGLALRFGKFTFDAPSSKVAIDLTGEGFQLDAGSFLRKNGLTLSYLVRSQSNPLLSSKRDNTAALLKFSTPLHRPDVTPDERQDGESGSTRHSILRTANLYLLYGRNQDQTDPHSYATIGTEVFFVRPPSAPPSLQCPSMRSQSARRRYVAGSGSFYFSRRGPGDLDRGGRGWVGLLRTTWSPKIEAKNDISYTAKETVTLLTGWGRADDTRTTRDESYIGENQGFSPDLIFFSTLSRPLQAGTTVISSGLGGKQFAQIQGTVAWSPLEKMARLLIGKEEVISWGTTVALEAIRLGNRRNGSHDAGQELDVRSVVETSGNVKTTLGVGWYRAGRAIDDVIRNDIFTVSLGLNIEP